MRVKENPVPVSALFKSDFIYLNLKYWSHSTDQVGSEYNLSIYGLQKN